MRAFDWLRGLVVPVMIFQHALALLQPALRDQYPAMAVRWLAMFVAPSFLLASGFALALTQVRAAQHGGRAARRVKTARRILEVFLVATLVNWMWYPIFSEPHRILRIDILQCIGLSLTIAFPLVTLLASKPRVLMAICVALAVGIFAVGPLGTDAQGPFARLVSYRDDTVFPLVPWVGWVFLGSAFGALAATGGTSALRKALVLAACVALPLWIATPWLKEAYPPHGFLNFNPADHAKRLTLLSLALIALLEAERRFAASRAWRVLEVFGTSSLAAYFVHEALLFFRIFGFSFEAVWGGKQEVWAYALLASALVAITFACCVAVDHGYKRASGVIDRFIERRFRSGPPAPPAALATGSSRDGLA